MEFVEYDIPNCEHPEKVLENRDVGIWRNVGYPAGGMFSVKSDLSGLSMGDCVGRPHPRGRPGLG